MLETDLKKAKSATKIVMPWGPELEAIVMQTVDTISKLVGSTLGPNGRTVLIERFESGLGPVQTKDGVTVARSLGFKSAIQQTILESFREAAIRTVSEAGDGTSTSVVLAQGILKAMTCFLKENKQNSPQQVLREINDFFENTVIPYIRSKTVKVNNNNFNDLLLSVANISTNGDLELSKYVLQAFNMVGDSGHITLTEEPGPKGFEISKVNGYAINRGWEASLGRYYNEFLNDEINNKLLLENCAFILVDGNVLDLSGLGRFFQLVEQQYHQDNTTPSNYILVAHQFSAQVLAQLAKSAKASAIKIVPLITPMDAIANSRFDFLKDLAAFTNGKIFNPISYPLGNGTPADLGKPMASFEMMRYRSVVHGQGNETSLIQRAQQLQTRKDSAGTSIFEKNILSERIGRLTGGLARLTIRDVSESAIKETRDRAEDAICAIRGAAKHGVLPGGGRILLNLSLEAAKSGSMAVQQILAPAFTKPLLLLLNNCGLPNNESKDILDHLIQNPDNVYNALTKTLGDPFELKLLDSTPAVLEAIRSAISIAGLLGTLGGVCVFARDDEFEREFAHKNNRLKNEMDNYEPDNSFMLDDI